MQLRIERSFSKIGDDWARLYGLTPEVSPFLHPDAMKIAVKYFYPYYLIRKCRPIFCVFYESDSVRAIAPMLKFLNGRVQLFGDANGFNESGFVYDSETILPECFYLMRTILGSVELIKIDSRSPLSKFVPTNAVATSNAAIAFPKDFDEYLKTLSKSVRQNIRTAYNRVNTDGYLIDIQYVMGGGRFPLTRVVNLYCKRHDHRYGVKTSWLKKCFLKTQSFATRYYRFSPNAMTFILYIDHQPAAFLSGLFSNDRLIVPRLSIDDKFKRYSPGMLLVVETIKYLQKYTSIEVLDLSQGGEQYKYQLGATEHLSYRFSI